MLYTTEEAEKLCFFHEVVEPGHLLGTSIRWAKYITRDCNTAYVMSKKALEDGVTRQIDQRTVALDATLAEGMSDEGNRRTQDRRRREKNK